MSLILALLIIVWAVVYSIGRLLFPQIVRYDDEIINQISMALRQPVRVSSIEAEWSSDSGPHFTFRDIQFLDPVTGSVVIEFSEAGVAIDTLSSLLTMTPRLGEMTLSGIDLALLRRADGSIVLEGFRSASHQPDELQRIMDWLLSQSRLGLQNSRLTWRDEMAPSSPRVFDEVNLDLRNFGRRHQFNGSANLPASFGQRLSFALDIRGDVMAPRGWSGETFIHGEGLQLGPLLAWLPPQGLQVIKGVVDADLWMQWRDASVQRIDGDVSAFGVVLQSTLPGGSEKSLNVDALSGRLAWQLRDQGWEAALDHLALGREGRVWPYSRIDVASHASAAGRDVAFTADYLEIEDLRAFAALLLPEDSPVLANLDQARPRGQLRAVRGTVLSQGETLNLYLHGAFQDLSLEAGKKLPALQGADGRFALRNDSGVLELDSDELTVELPRLFRTPLAISHAGGTVSWAIHDGGIQLALQQVTAENDDLRLVIDGDVDVLPGTHGGAYVDVLGRFDVPEHGLRRLGQYLPAGIMKPSLVRWLEQSVQDGRVPYGALILRGHSADFPFERGTGKFEVRFGVANGVLSYDRSWPQLTALAGELAFTDHTMEIVIDGGHSFDSSIRHATVTIDELRAHPQQLRINGHVEGASADVLRYLADTPLQTRFGHMVADMKAEGRSTLDLDLLLAPGGGAPPRVTGSLGMLGSQLFIADRAVDLRDIRGTVTFGEDGLNGKGLTANVLGGMPARFDVSTIALAERQVTVIEASGRASGDDVRRLTGQSLFKYLSGSTDWQASVHVLGGEPSQIDITVRSDLQNMSSSLPYPLTKSARQQLPLTVSMIFPRTLDKPVYFRLGSLLNGVLDMDARMHLERGEIRSGETPAQLPGEPGLRISGDLDAFSYTGWGPYIDEMRGGGPGAGDGAGISQVDMQFGLFEMFNHPFRNARLRAVRAVGGWQFDIDSLELAGRIRLPLGSTAPITLDLERLILSSAAGGPAIGAANKGLDPRDLPPLKIHSKQFIFDARNFGELDLVASKRPSGVHLDKLRMASPAMTVDARGDWLYVNDEHFSSFSIDFSSENFGKALSSLGYAGTIKGGASDISIVARWPGTPTAFALDGLDGTMHMKIVDGHLLDIEPGAGRLLGLLSLQAMPRRLFLDFRDLFEKGLAFDRMKGSFTFANGQAVTSDMYMDAPAAHIDVRGRVGLVEQDYDQRVVVTPQLTTGLPVAGALAGGVGVGAAILVIQELLQPQLKKAGRLEYHITGPWNNPVIEQVAGGGRPDKGNNKR